MTDEDSLLGGSIAHLCQMTCPPRGLSAQKRPASFRKPAPYPSELLRQDRLEAHGTTQGDGCRVQIVACAAYVIEFVLQHFATDGVTVCDFI